MHYIMYYQGTIDHHTYTHNFSSCKIKAWKNSGYITNSQCEELPVSWIAQLVEHCTDIAEAMGSNPMIQPWIFFSGIWL